MKTKLKLGTKLLLSFAAVALIALVVGSVGYYGAAKNQQAMHETGSVRLPGVDSLLITKASLERIRAVVETISDADASVELRKKEYDELTQLREKYASALKTYEALPKTTEEASLMARFEPALAAWRAENNKALELSSKFESSGIVGPESIATKIEQFTKDHYIAVQKVLLLLRSKDNTFAGGDDDTACNAGKWLPTFQTSSAALRTEVQGIVEPHHRFHVAVGKIKKLVAEGKADEAAQIFQQEMNPAMQDVFIHFDAMQAAVTKAIAIHRSVEEQVAGPVMKTQEAAIAVLDLLVQVNRDVASSTVRNSNAQGTFLKSFSLIAMIVGTIAAAIMGILVTRSITRPIQRVTDQLSAGADQANAAADQVSRASQDLAAGASEQAAAVEETSSSLEELGAGEAARAPVCRAWRFGLQCGLDQFPHAGGIVAGFASAARRDLPHATDALLAHTPAPQRDRASLDVELLGAHLHRLTRRRGEDDPCPQHDLLRRRTSANPLLKADMLCARQNHRHTFS